MAVNTTPSCPLLVCTCAPFELLFEDGSRDPVGRGSSLPNLKRWGVWSPVPVLPGTTFEGGVLPLALPQVQELLGVHLISDIRTDPNDVTTSNDSEYE